MSSQPHCKVFMGDSVYLVAAHQYQALRDRLDTCEQGWIELELVEHPAGRAFIKLENVKDLLYAPAEWCEAWEAIEEEKRQERLARGEG